MRRRPRLVLVGAPALALCLASPAAAGSISISMWAISSRGRHAETRP